MTSRFLKFNTKEKAWEEVSNSKDIAGQDMTGLHNYFLNLFLTFGVDRSSSVLHLQISPMAARDKCGHALRFANRLKCKKNAAVMVRQKSQSNTSAAPAPGIISPTSSLSPTAVGLNAVAAAAATHSQSALGADASQLSEQKQPQQSLVQLHSQMEQQQPQASAAQRLIFSELLKRYDTMWGASHIQALAGLHTSASPSTAAAAASFLRAAAAAGTLVPAPSGTPQTLMHPLGVSADTQHSVGTDAGLGGHATVTSASPAAAPVATTAPTSAPDSINAGGSRSSPTGDHTRKATLDDLCSLLLAAKNTSS